MIIKPIYWNICGKCLKENVVLFNFLNFPLLLCILNCSPSGIVDSSWQLIKTDEKGRMEKNYDMIDGWENDDEKEKRRILEKMITEKMKKMKQGMEES